MFLIKTSVELPGAHHLTLPYESKCSSIHGHTYKFVFTFKCHMLNSSGMLIDFTAIKKSILNNFIEQHDHCNWDGILSAAFESGYALSTNPTSEVMAHYVFHYVEHDLEKYNANSPQAARDAVLLHSVEVWESPTNGAIYQP